MQSSQSSSASSILILDLVTKFLNKVLEKDRNHSYYLKQWESFRVLLSASPLDLNPVFGHLASITPLPEPISSSPGLNSRSPGISSRSPGLKTRPSSTTDQYALVKNRSFHVNTERDVATSFQVTLENSYDGLSYLESEVPHKRTSSNAGISGPITITTTNPVDLRRHTSHKPSTFANIGEGTSASEIKSTPFSLEDMLNGSLGNLGIPSTELKTEVKTQKPYHMGFLTSISKQLRDGIERRSDNVLKSFSRTKEAQAFIGEPRSPLRKVKVYEKQKEGQSNQLDLGKLLTPNYTANYTSVNTSAGSKLDYMSRVKLY